MPGNNRRTIDIAFTRVKLAVYVDGCFWHGCPEHHVRPRANAEWWDWKIGRNQQRDRSTDAELEAAGWRVAPLLGAPRAGGRGRRGRSAARTLGRPPQVEGVLAQLLVG